MRMGFSIGGIVVTAIVLYIGYKFGGMLFPKVGL